MNATAGVQYLRARPRLIKGMQLALLVLTLGFCVWAVRDQWSKAGPLLAHASPAYLALSFAIVAVYYLVFILGWIRMLDAWDIHVPYRVALQAEMVSMLAKYLPGGVWTPAARTVALRRYGGRHRHADGARVDPRRGCALGDLRRDRLRGQPRVGARRERAAAAARRLRAVLAALAPPAHLPAAFEQAPEAVRRRRRSSRCRSR